MDRAEYLRRKEWFAERHPRGQCARCLRAPLTCYCERVQSFDPGIQFQILIHGREAQKRIATGRMAHLCLENSRLLPGYDYSSHPGVNATITDPETTSVVLYPGEGSVDLSALSASARKNLFPAHKPLAVFVIDGTWITARKTMQRSANLAALPRICFTPAAPSRFRVRKQPGEECFSTIEAIHQTIELLGEGRGFDLSARRHDQLLHLFDSMVDQQLDLSSRPKLYCQWKPPRRGADLI